MDNQLIISVGREFGSGGHVIAEALAKKFDLPLLDHNILEHIALEKNISHEKLKKYDEQPKNKLISRKVRGHSNSPHDHVAEMQFEFLKKKAEKGESFVVVGRCSETMLKDYDGMISIFILGDREVKKERVKTVYNLSGDEAARLMEREDLKRKMYHNNYCKGKWGDARNYDIAINSSRLGIDTTVDILETYIRTRMNQEK